MPTLRLEIINELGEVGLTDLIDVETKAEAWERIKGAHRFYWPQGFFTRYSMPDEFEPRDYSALNKAFRELAEEGAAIMARAGQESEEDDEPDCIRLHGGGFSKTGY